MFSTCAEPVPLCVGGYRFLTTTSTTTSLPDSDLDKYTTVDPLADTVNKSGSLLLREWRADQTLKERYGGTVHLQVHCAIESTPSLWLKLAPVACKLEKKYCRHPHDSGVVLSELEDEGNNSGSHAMHDFVLPASASLLVHSWLLQIGKPHHTSLLPVWACSGVVAPTRNLSPQSLATPPVPVGYSSMRV